MLVRFGTTILNNGWRKDLATSEHDLVLRFLRAKFNHVYSEIDKYMLAGWTHLRLPNMNPRVDIDIIREVLDSGKLDAYKDVLKNHKISFSNHNHYICNSVNRNNIDTITDYILKLNMITDFMGIVDLQMCNHVNNNKFEEIVNSLRDIRSIIGDDIYSRLCIENSENGFNLKKCIDLAACTDTRVIFDNLHHRINNNKEMTNTLIKSTVDTWSIKDTVKMHYSNGNMRGAHNSNFNLKEFMELINQYRKYTNELIVVVELSYSKEIIENLRYNKSLRWNNDLTFNQ